MTSIVTVGGIERFSCMCGPHSCWHCAYKSSDHGSYKCPLCGADTLHMPLNHETRLAESRLAETVYCKVSSRVTVSYLSTLNRRGSAGTWCPPQDVPCVFPESSLSINVEPFGGLTVARWRQEAGVLIRDMYEDDRSIIIVTGSHPGIWTTPRASDFA